TCMPPLVLSIVPEPRSTCLHGERGPRRSCSGATWLTPPRVTGPRRRRSHLNSCRTASSGSIARRRLDGDRTTDVSAGALVFEKEAVRRFEYNDDDGRRPAG